MSCMKCVFCSLLQWVIIKLIDLIGFCVIGDYECEFGVMIYCLFSVDQQVVIGVFYVVCFEDVVVVMVIEYLELILVDDW